MAENVNQIVHEYDLPRSEYTPIREGSMMNVDLGKTIGMRSPDGSAINALLVIPGRNKEMSLAAEESTRILSRLEGLSIHEQRILGRVFHVDQKALQPGGEMYGKLAFSQEARERLEQVVEWSNSVIPPKQDQASSNTLHSFEGVLLPVAHSLRFAIEIVNRIPSLLAYKEDGTTLLEVLWGENKYQLTKGKAVEVVRNLMNVLHVEDSNKSLEHRLPHLQSALAQLKQELPLSERLIDNPYKMLPEDRLIRYLTGVPVREQLKIDKPMAISVSQVVIPNTHRESREHGKTSGTTIVLERGTEIHLGTSFNQIETNAILNGLNELLSPDKAYEDFLSSSSDKKNGIINKVLQDFTNKKLQEARKRLGLSDSNDAIIEKSNLNALLIMVVRRRLDQRIVNWLNIPPTSDGRFVVIKTHRSDNDVPWYSYDLSFPRNEERKRTKEEMEADRRNALELIEHTIVERTNAA